MKKLLLILLLLPFTSFSQISEVDESDLGTQIGGICLSFKEVLKVVLP